METQRRLTITSVNNYFLKSKSIEHEHTIESHKKQVTSLHNAKLVNNSMPNEHAVHDRNIMGENYASITLPQLKGLV